MINIYSSDGHTILAKVPITREAVHEEEMMTSNFVRLSWKAKVGGILPAGSYIQPFDDELDASGRPVKYYLFENYSPTAEKENRFTYTPQFEHPIMWLGKIPFIHLTGDTTTWDSATKNYEWTYTGPAGTIAREVVEYIERWCGRDVTFASIFGTGWTSMPVGNLPSTATCSFNANDVLSAAATIANAFECEYHFDFENKVFYLGFMGQAQMQGSSTELKTGVNIGVANISKTKKEYYNRYVVLGGTKNLTQQTASGENVQLTTRLTLDEVQYPDSIIDLRGNNSFPDIMASANEPMMTGELVFDDIYPKIELYIYNPRERKCWLLDENKQKVEDPNGELDTTDGKKYKTYSKWYVRLAYYTTSPISGKQTLNTETKDGVTYYWYEFEMSEELRVADTPLSMLFQANYDSNLSSALAGREFEVVWYDETPSEPEKGEDDKEAAGFQPMAGDYRIEFDDSSGIIIPTTSNAGLCPYGGSAPSLQNNKVTLVNIVLDNTYKTMAQSELREAAVRKIQWLRSDLNTYSFNSNPLAFRLHNPHLYIGQSVIYDDGQDLNGSTSYRVATHVRKLVTRLDNPYIQEISVGNEKVRGSISSMKEQIEIIIAGGYGSGSGEGGGISEAQFLNLLRNYGSRLFLSKVKADSADGKITFLNGADFGSNGLWGYVREVLVNGEARIRAWFRNLYADYFEPTVMKVVEKILGPLSVAGNLFVTHDDQGRNGNLTVAEDITAGGTLRAANADILGMLTTKNLTVTGLAHFFELIIDKIKASGGAFLITPADGFEVEKVEAMESGGVTTGYRLYWTATDDSKNRYNKWEIGDQAICQTFNLANKEGGRYRDAGNKYYWALVTDVSGEYPSLISEYVYTKVATPVESELLNELYYTESNGIYTLCTDGSLNNNKVYYTRSTDTKEMHYITISSSDYDRSGGGSVNPEVGDEVAMLGHRIQNSDMEGGVVKESAKARQSAIYLAAYNSIDHGLRAPLLAFYKGINNYDLSSHRGTYIDADGSKFVGQFVSSSTGQDLEQILTGNEFNIIYGDGNPNTVTTPHMAWNYEANEYLSHVGWLYFDINLEPANTDGGRLYRWSQVGNEVTGNFHGFYWVAVNDIDSLAALDKIADVASDSKLTGGGEKTRVLLQWKEALEYYAQTVAVTPVEMAASSETCMGSTFAAIYSAAQSTWAALCTYLNGQQTFDGGVQDAPLWISTTLDENRIKKENASEPSMWKACLLVTTVLPTLSEVQNETAADTYRRKWSAFYEAMATLDAAQLKWQEKSIDEMGDDNLLDSEEKASLRQVFNGEVLRYFELIDDAAGYGVDTYGNYTGTYIDDNGDEQTLSDTKLTDAINHLGSYLDNNFQRSLTPISPITPGTLPANTWWIVDEVVVNSVRYSMRNGLIDPQSNYSSHSANPTRYPLWLQRQNETEDTVVDDDEWDSYWNTYFNARAEMVDMLARARKKAIDEAADDIDLPNTYYTRFADGQHSPTRSGNTWNYLTPELMPGTPTTVPIKVGDTWYEEAALVNPVTNALVTEGNNNETLYNIYKCVQGYNSNVYYSNRLTYWRLISKPVGTLRFSDLGIIYDAVFEQSEFTTVVQNVNSITSTVGKIIDGRNMLLNGDFSEVSSYSYVAHFGLSGGNISNPQRYILNTTSGHADSVLVALGFKYYTALPVTTASDISGLYMSTSLQPNITLEEGKTYTLSAWLKKPSGNTTLSVRVKRGTIQSPTTIGDMKVVGSSTPTSLTTSWQRYYINITGDGTLQNLYLVLISNGNSSTGTFHVGGIQLEEGNTVTDWDLPLQKAKSIIRQTANEISLKVSKDELATEINSKADEITAFVTKNGAVQSGLTLGTNGMTIDASKLTISGTMNKDVTINGDCLHIENDLDIKGLTTENVTIVPRNHSKPTVINMGIVDEEETNPTIMKSVQVRAVNTSWTTSYPLSADSHLVVLPFYDSLVGSTDSNAWPNTSGNYVKFNKEDGDNVAFDSTSPLFRSFMLHHNTSVKKSERRVVAWKQNGTRITITNEVDIYCMNWETMPSSYANDGSSRNALSGFLISRSVIVCADPRIVCADNLMFRTSNAQSPFVATLRCGGTSQRNWQSESADSERLKAGYFSYKGYRARFIVLLPGQSLQLRSQIIKIGNDGREVLVWVVENTNELELMKVGNVGNTLYEFSIGLGKSGDSINYYGEVWSNAVAFAPSGEHNATIDCILGPNAANYYTTTPSTTFEIGVTPT